MQSYELGDPILQLIKDNIETFGISEHAFTLLTNSLIKLILKKPNEPDLGGSNPHPQFFTKFAGRTNQARHKLRMVSYPEDYRGEEKEEQAIVRIRIPLDRSQLQERTLPTFLPFPSLSLLLPYNPHFCSIRIKIGGSG